LTCRPPQDIIVKKANGILEFNYISSKRKARDNVGPLLNEAGVLVTEDAEKAELL